VKKQQSVQLKEADFLFQVFPLSALCSVSENGSLLIVPYLTSPHVAAHHIDSL
jgi:hypothetical protein